MRRRDDHGEVTSDVRLATTDDLAKLAEFNRTEHPFPDDVSLLQLIEPAARAHGSRVAVIADRDPSGDGPLLTYEELATRADGVARALREAGVRRGDVVGVMVERSVAMVVGLLGVMKAGAAYLPIAPDNPIARTEYMLVDAGVHVLLVQRSTRPHLDFTGRIIDIDDVRPARGEPSIPPDVGGPDDLAYVIYTSGSTGKPKGVMVEHRGLVNRLHWMQSAYPIDHGDVILQKTPYYFDVSVWELFWGMLHGATLCLLPPGGEKFPLAIVDTIRKHRVTVMHFVPSMLSVFLEYLEGKNARTVAESLASVRRVFASGEALSPSHVRRFNALWGERTGTQLTNLYGPTEATVDVSHYDCPTHGDVDTIPIGRPIHNTRFHVMHEGREVAIGEAGELCIAGVGLARGYLNNPTLTHEVFIDNPANPGERIYRTGDIARWRTDGNVEYLGRKDHQVKIRGLRIELGEIENAVRARPGVSDCVVVVKRYSESVVLIVAYVVCEAEFDIPGLREYLRDHLPQYMVPNHFEKIRELPLTPTGKTDRASLPEPTLHAVPA